MALFQRMTFHNAVHSLETGVIVVVEVLKLCNVSIDDILYRNEICFLSFEKNKKESLFLTRQNVETVHFLVLSPWLREGVTVHGVQNVLSTLLYAVYVIEKTNCHHFSTGTQATVGLLIVFYDWGFNCSVGIVPFSDGGRSVGGNFRRGKGRNVRPGNLIGAGLT